MNRQDTNKTTIIIYAFNTALHVKIQEWLNKEENSQFWQRIKCIWSESQVLECLQQQSVDTTVILCQQFDWETHVHELYVSVIEQYPDIPVYLCTNEKAKLNGYKGIIEYGNPQLVSIPLTQKLSALLGIEQLEKVSSG